jgi:predicted phage terminase large subunit-like protein
MTTKSAPRRGLGVCLAPQPGPQTVALASKADIVIFGGAAGGGKTYGLLLEPLRHIGTKGFGAVIFRRTYSQVAQQGGLWDETFNIYTHVGGTAHKGAFTWNWPAGAEVRFGHLNLEQTKYDYQGAQIALMGFDELTHFSESQFFYMLSRNRSICGVKPYVRCTCNPDPDSWVATFLEWWIDQETGYPLPERAGVVRYFVRDGNDLAWGDDPRELEAQVITPGVIAKSACFVPSKVYDNKILMARDPGYIANLMSLPLVERDQLLGGNWKIRVSAGRLFNRGWFEIVQPETVPKGGVAVRFADFAATARSMTRRDPDYTAAVKMIYVNDTWYVADVIAGQWAALDAEKTVQSLARQDAIIEAANYRQFMYRWEEEPGSASIRDTARQIHDMRGLDAGGLSVNGRGDKVTRAKPFAAQCEAGNVKLVAGPWNEMWLSHMHHQPEAPHDDVMDASVGAWLLSMSGNAGIETGSVEMFTR